MSPVELEVFKISSNEFCLHVTELKIIIIIELGLGIDPIIKLKLLTTSVFVPTASRKRVLLGVSIYHVGGGVWMYATQLSFVQHEKPSEEQLETSIYFITFK